MNIYPKIYLDNVKEITISLLNKHNIKGLILDIDNTLIDYKKNMLSGVVEWAKGMKQGNIKLCILSNTYNSKKVKKVAKELDIPYFYFAKKPLKCGFNKAREILKLPSKNIGVVGDQIFTDVFGANRCNMFPILVKPITKKDSFFITKLKRPIENKILKIYQNKM